MQTRIGSILLGLAGLLALPAAAEDVVLRPRFSQGDSYALSLSAKSNAALVSRGATPVDFAEDGALTYTATVVVLETDGQGMPVRERHQGVELTSERPGRPGTLFLSGTFEVQRRDGGDVRVFVAGERAERSVERVVARLLSNQLEFAVGALVDPGRPVAVGESWEIPVAQVRAYLRGQGLRDVELDAPASATLGRGDGGRLAVRYRIPIDSFLLRKMPANAHASRSEGSLEGTLQLGSQHRPVHHASTLALSLRGAVVKSGVSTSYPWSYQSTQALDQRTRRVEPELASAF